MLSNMKKRMTSATRPYLGSGHVLERSAKFPRCLRRQSERQPLGRSVVAVRIHISHWRQQESRQTSEGMGEVGVQVATPSDSAPSASIPIIEQNRPKEHRSIAEAPEQRDLFARARRRKLSDERKSITHKFSVGGHEGYIIVGMYEEGAPGEIFIKMAKEGSTLSGFMDGLALSISIGLQYGVPLKALVDKLTNTRFEPSGFTKNPSIRYASSVLITSPVGLGVSSFHLNISNRELP